LKVESEEELEKKDLKSPLRIEVYRFEGQALKKAELVKEFKFASVDPSIKSKDYLKVHDFDDHFDNPTLAVSKVL